MRQERIARESQELRHCTFTPEVNRGVPPAKTGPVVVRGLGRHLEMQELARRRKEDQAKREAQTFLTNPQGTTQPFTIPKPFKLTESTSHREQRYARALQQHEQAEMAECTFRPATRQAEQRELIASILNEPYISPEEALAPTGYGADWGPHPPLPGPPR
mmetsp:Transcript_7079/g.19990  ORF Transcript_7079/g.19990 Transcript_7079/m.19990 type:complete len:160 (-) Transcript_7079:34-513(-)